MSKGYDLASFSTLLLADLAPSRTDEQFTPYRYDPARYIEEKLGWKPWSGGDETPGQVEVIDAYTLALQQQHEKRGWELGEIDSAALRTWQPGQPIRNWLRIESGHTIGKTKVFAGLVNHFFDCFAPSIIYTFAPSWKQIHDLLWKEIKADRRGRGLPGRILDLRLEVADNHFATGSATSDAGGKGTTRIQGQHSPYLLFVLDEAEGIPDFVWGAVDSMAGGGICVILMAANPQTRSSRFHKAKSLSYVRSFRISCLSHPNVREGREIIPGAVQRHYVERMIEKHCEPAPAHDADEHTFEAEFPVQLEEKTLAAGTIFRPNAEFLFRVLGIAPANVADNTLVPTGRYEAACKRPLPDVPPITARMGVDVARFGKDYGTLYLRLGNHVRRVQQFWRQDTTEYWQAIRRCALALPKTVTSLHVRVDGGGGFGSGVIDPLKKDSALIERFPDFQVHEVHFGTPKVHEPDAYFDLATEMYAASAEALKAISISSAPEALEGDLCERQYVWRMREGIAVKKLEAKDEFRKPQRLGRSPDDGDGFVLATSPDHLFERGTLTADANAHQEFWHGRDRDPLFDDDELYT